MEFTIELYESVTGGCPVQEFLDELKETDPGDFAAVMAGLAKLRNRQYHRPPLSKSIGDDLFELRHVGKLNTRMLYPDVAKVEDAAASRRPRMTL